MIKTFCKAWTSEGEKLAKKYIKESPPRKYGDLVRLVARVLSETVKEEPTPDPAGVLELNVSQYNSPAKQHSGVLVFLLKSQYFSVSKSVWTVRIDYGSCSVCDTFLRVKEQSKEEELSQIEGYLTMCLHIVQGLRLLEGDCLGDIDI